MNIIDRLTGALLRAFFSRPVDEQIISVTQDEAKDLIKAVLLEMRQPNEEMIKAINGAADWNDGESAWEAGIEVALKE